MTQNIQKCAEKYSTSVLTILNLLYMKEVNINNEKNNIKNQNNCLRIYKSLFLSPNIQILFFKNVFNKKFSFVFEVCYDKT